MQFFNSFITLYLHSSLPKFSASPLLKNRTIFINPYICVLSDSQFRSKVTYCEMMLCECAFVSWSIIDRLPGVFYIRMIWRSHSRFGSARRSSFANNANVLHSQHHFISIKSNWHVAGVYLMKLRTISPSSLNRAYKVLLKVL